MLTPRQGELIADRYRLEQELARGGMGSVWAGQDEKLRRKIAVKLVAPDLVSAADAAERFEREAMAVAKLQSPHVVQIFDYGIERQCPFIVMELLDGEDLRNRLHRNKRLSLDAAAQILVQAAKALSVAHAAGIIHRDLKPGNIYMVRAGEEEIVKVLDFGVAANATDLLTGGVAPNVIGTPQFMSPEQARGLTLDHRTDLWSLGVITYRALTGRLPFRGGSPTEVIVKVCTETPEAVSKLAPDLPYELDAFFAKALARERERRFRSAREMALAMSRISPVNFTTLSMPDPKAIEEAIRIALEQNAEDEAKTMAVDLEQQKAAVLRVNEEELDNLETRLHLPSPLPPLPPTEEQPQRGSIPLPAPPPRRSQPARSSTPARDSAPPSRAPGTLRGTSLPRPLPPVPPPPPGSRLSKSVSMPRKAPEVMTASSTQPAPASQPPPVTQPVIASAPAPSSQPVPSSKPLSSQPLSSEPLPSTPRMIPPPLQPPSSRAGSNGAMHTPIRGGAAVALQVPEAPASDPGDGAPTVLSLLVDDVDDTGPMRKDALGTQPKLQVPPAEPTRPGGTTREAFRIPLPPPPPSKPSSPISLSKPSAPPPLPSSPGSLPPSVPSSRMVPPPSLPSRPLAPPPSSSASAAAATLMMQESPPATAVTDDGQTNPVGMRPSDPGLGLVQPDSRRPVRSARPAVLMALGAVLAGVLVAVIGSVFVGKSNDVPEGTPAATPPPSGETKPAAPPPPSPPPVAASTESPGPASTATEPPPPVEVASKKGPTPRGGEPPTPRTAKTAEPAPPPPAAPPPPPPAKTADPFADRL
jgi:eukaryotic-like serine/threonine-protein kinase